jgi:SAM-dependent methyltransferase
LVRQELVEFNQRHRDRWVEKIARSLPKGTRILDVGAGEGRYRSLFAHCDYRTQDLGEYQGTSEGLLKDNWKYAQIDYLCDASAIPCDDGSFDAILCTEVLEHVREPIKVLNEIRRIVKTGGRVFISAPLGSGLHQQPYHYYGGFTPYFYRHFLSELGFEVISVEPNGLFFRMLLQELDRGIRIIRANRKYPYWHPAHWALRAMASKRVAQWLTELDEQIPVTEFTVGYHVEAQKVPLNTVRSW